MLLPIVSQQAKGKRMVSFLKGIWELTALCHQPLLAVAWLGFMSPAWLSSERPALSHCHSGRQPVGTAAARELLPLPRLPRASQRHLLWKSPKIPQPGLLGSWWNDSHGATLARPWSPPEWVRGSLNGAGAFSTRGRVFFAPVQYQVSLGGCLGGGEGRRSCAKNKLQVWARSKGGSWLGWHWAPPCPAQQDSFPGQAAPAPTESRQEVLCWGPQERVGGVTCKPFPLARLGNTAARCPPPPPSCRCHPCLDKFCCPKLAGVFVFWLLLAGGGRGA